MWRRGAVAVAVAVGALCLVPRPAAAQEARVLLRIEDPRVVESSGLAVGRRHPGVLWTHNDSGDAARVFAVGRDGRVLATLRFAGVEARDWEAVAVGRDDRGGSALFVGDIGDNQGLWPSVTVYRAAEPASLRDATVPVRRYRLRYPDGPRDAEALLVDPRSNRLYLASKEDAGGGLYRAPAQLRSDRVNLLRRVGRVPPLVTDGAFSPDGRLLVLRDYLAAHLYGAPRGYAAPGGRLATVPLPPQPQGESVAFSADGRSLLAGSEGDGSEVWRVPLPAAAAPPAASATTLAARQPPPAGQPATAPPARARGGAPPFALLAAAGGALVAVAGGGLAAWSRRRARRG
jgi:hypothetical protein